MPLANILDAMEQAVAGEIQNIETQTAASVAEIRAAAENDARAIRERHQREMEPVLQHERARRLNRARLDALRQVSRAREKLLGDALDTARERLAHLRSDSSYADILRALTQETLAQFDAPVIIHADPRDEKILRALFPHAQIQFDIETWGGIHARTADEKICVVNTLEARLTQAQHALRQHVMPLFDGNR